MTQQEVLTLLLKVKHDAHALSFEKIGLFGSFATATAHAMSDVDNEIIVEIIIKRLPLIKHISLSLLH